MKEVKQGRFSILFMDLRDSTPLSRQLPPRDYRVLIEFTHEIMEQIFKKNNVFFYKFAGDDGMALFENDEKSHGALECLNAVVQFREALDNSRYKKYKFGAGLNIGNISIIYKDNNVLECIGEALNITAKIEKLSKEGEFEQIFLSDTFYNYLLSLFENQESLFLFNKKNFPNRIKEYTNIVIYELKNELSKDTKIIQKYLVKLINEIQDNTRLFWKFEPHYHNVQVFNATLKEIKKALLLIFISIGFEIEAIKEMEKKIFFSFFLKCEKGKIGFIILDKFLNRSTRVQIYNYLKQNIISKIFFFQCANYNIDGKLIASILKDFKPFSILYFSGTEITRIHSMFIRNNSLRIIIRNFFYIDKSYLSEKEFKKYIIEYQITKKLGEWRKKIKESFEVESTILNMLGKSGISLGEIGEYIKHRSPSLSIEILRWVNSAYLRGLDHIGDIPSATARLGENVIREIIYSCQVEILIPNIIKTYDRKRKELLKHFQLAGIFCQLFAKEIGLQLSVNINGKKKIVTDFYSLGFLHDIGMCLVDNIISVYFEDILKDKNTIFINRIKEIEMGINHAYLSKYILDTFQHETGIYAWVLPIEMLNGIKYHHEPFQIKENGNSKKIAILLSIVETLFEAFHDEDLSNLTNFNNCLDFFKISLKKVLSIQKRTIDIYNKREAQFK